MFDKLPDLQAVAFHLKCINNAQKNVAARITTTDTFERGMKVGYENATSSITPYVEELTQLVDALQEYFDKPYMIDDITCEEANKSESA